MKTAAAAAVETWEVPPDAQRACDSLLQCLVNITVLLGTPRTAEALIAGMPVTPEGLTPELFTRAAARAGLSAKVVRRSLAEISSLVLPSVLLLKNRQACVLVARVDETSRLQVLFPESGGVSEIELADLERLYAGHAIFARPRIRLDARSERSVRESPGHWFW